MREVAKNGHMITKLLKNTLSTSMIRLVKLVRSNNYEMIPDILKEVERIRWMMLDIIYSSCMRRCPECRNNAQVN